MNMCLDGTVHLPGMPVMVMIILLPRVVSSGDQYRHQETIAIILLGRLPDVIMMTIE
jgi:hypothetical protein